MQPLHPHLLVDVQLGQRADQRTDDGLGVQRVGLAAHHSESPGGAQARVELHQLFFHRHLHHLLDARQLDGVLHLLVVHQLQVVQAECVQAGGRGPAADGGQVTLAVGDAAQRL